MAIVKNTKNVISAVVIVIAVGVLLFFAGPAPEKEEGVRLFRIVSIILSALACIALLVVLVKYNKDIIRLIITNLPVAISVITAGLFACILFFGDWPSEIMMKVELLPSVIITSLALAGFAIALLGVFRDNNGSNEELGMPNIRAKKSRVLIYQSVTFGCLTILATMVYFVIHAINMIYVAWLLFILQLALLVVPLLFAKIIVLR